MSPSLLIFCLAIGFAFIAYSEPTQPRIVGKKYEDRDEEIGIEFIDISGDLSKYVEFEVEVLVDNIGFLEGPVWIDDYLLFTEPLAQNIWKYSPKDNNIELWSNYNDIGGGCTGLAFTNTYPDELWASCHFAHKIIKINITTHEIIESFDHKTYHKNRDTKFEPNDIVIDKYGNVYFTDLPLARSNEEGARGGVYHINRNNSKMTLVQLMGYGPNGIALNNDENLLVAANFIDFPIEIYDYNNFEQYNWENIFIRGFKKSSESEIFNVPFDYLVTHKKPYYDYFEHDHYDMFFDSNSFDQYDNLWQALYFNLDHEGGQITVLNNKGSGSDDAYYIGNIRTRKSKYSASNLENGNDGCMYATSGSFEQNIGSLVRYKIKHVVDKKDEL